MNTDRNQYQPDCAQHREADEIVAEGSAQLGQIARTQRANGREQQRRPTRGLRQQAPRNPVNQPKVHSLHRAQRKHHGARRQLRHRVIKRQVQQRIVERRVVRGRDIHVHAPVQKGPGVVEMVVAQVPTAVLPEEQRQRAEGEWRKR